LAQELVRLNVDVIVANGTPCALAVQKATSTIPVVMVAVGDPMAVGLVKSLGRPEANITGISNLFGDLGPKLLEILRGVVPKLTRVALLTHPENAFHRPLLKQVQSAGQKIKVTIISVEARSAQDIELAFAAMNRQGVGAVVVGQDSFFIQQRFQLVELATKYRLASISGFREYAEAGGLVGYGSNIADHWHRAAAYVDKILKGAKPSELPVEQPTKFEFVINKKTANVLGLKISQSLLISADKVIE
jgi:putative ABC transport system substrate-binding protein